MRKPCGRVEGHGLYCCEGYLCGNCEELRSLDAKVEGLDMDALDGQAALDESNNEVHRLKARVEGLEREITDHAEWARALTDDPSSEPYRKLLAELKDLRTITAEKIRGAWHGLENGQSRGEVMEDLAAIAHGLDEGR